MRDRVDDLRDQIARLTPEQRAALESRLRERQAPVETAATIRSRPDQTTWPMSAAQMRIWALSRLRPDDPVYNMQRAWRLQGSLHIDALESGLQAIMQRHETLRARFTHDGGRPVQEIRTLDGSVLTTEALDGDDRVDPLARARAIAKAEAETPFDPTSDLLVRARLIALGDDDHVLVITAHHLVCDGWSMDVIERELSTLYAAHGEGRSAALDPLPVHYADVAVWQEQRRQAAAGRRDLEYWKKRLEAPIEPLRLPGHGGGRPRPVHEGGHLEFSLDGDLSTAVRKLSRDARVTPFMTLLTGFQLALHHHTGQEDVVVCSPAAGRIHLAMEPLVGYFNNLVVLRGDLSGDPTVTELLERNRGMVLEAFDHQGAPFQDVAALPDVAAVPLVRGLFVLQETSEHPLEMPGLSVSPLDVAAENADFAIGVFMRQREDEFRAVVRFQRSMLTPEEVDGLMARFASVLGAMCAQPDAPRSTVVPVDTAMAPQVAEGSAGESAARPTSLLESQLVEIWERLFKRSPISIHADFFDLGGHSLLAAELLAELERDVVDEPMPLATLLRAPTIAQLANVIAQGGWRESWASLVPIQPEGASPPLFFVHAHGGNVIGYRDLAKRLGPEQPFYGLQSPEKASGAGEVAARRLEEMAAHYLAEIKTVQRHGPYALGGWCLGGDVAFEMARQLEASGEDVAVLLMIDNPRPEFVAPEMMVSPLHRTWNRIRTRLAMEWSNLAEVSWSQKPRFAVDRSKRLGERALIGVERLVGRWVRIPHSRAYRQQQVAAAHEKAYEKYQPGPYAGPATLIRAEQQPYGRAADSALGWERYVDGEIEVIEAPGHRVGLLSEPRVETVAEQIQGVMDKAFQDSESTP